MKSAGNAVIPTFPMHRSHGLQGSLKRRYKHPSPTSINGYHTAKKLLSQSPAKRPTFAFTSESEYTLGFLRKIAHNGTHAETGAFRTGPLSLPSERSARSQTSPGRVSEQRTLPFLGLGRGHSRRTQRAFGTAMRLCVSLFRGVAAPLGCVALLPLFVQHDLLGWKDLTKRSGRVTITRNNRTASRLALVWEPHRAVK